MAAGNASGEYRHTASTALRPDTALVGIHDSLDDRQSQTRSRRPVRSYPQPGRNGRTRVPVARSDRFAHGSERSRSPLGRPTATAMPIGDAGSEYLSGIVHQLRDRRTHHLAIRQHRRLAVRNRKTGSARGLSRADRSHGRGHQFRKVQRLAPRLEFGRIGTARRPEGASPGRSACSTARRSGSSVPVFVSDSPPAASSPELTVRMMVSGVLISWASASRTAVRSCSLRRAASA